jgi:hypothetical protein
MSGPCCLLNGSFLLIEDGIRGGKNGIRTNQYADSGARLEFDSGQFHGSVYSQRKKRLTRGGDSDDL